MWFVDLGGWCIVIEKGYVGGLVVLVKFEKSFVCFEVEVGQVLVIDGFVVIFESFDMDFNVCYQVGENLIYCVFYLLILFRIFGSKDDFVFLLMLVKKVFLFVSFMVKV